MDTDSYDSVSDMFFEMDKKFKKEHPIADWVDVSLFRGKGLFGYAPHYSLTHPAVLLKDLGREIKFAWQRVFRGWDDRVIWSIDFWLDDIMPDILEKYKKENRGLPHFSFDGIEPDKNGEYSQEQYKQAKNVWEKEIDKMISGFVASKQKEDLSFETKEQYDTEYETLEKKRIEGMTVFVKRYNTLWD